MAQNSNNPPNYFGLLGAFSSPPARNALWDTTPPAYNGFADRPVRNALFDPAGYNGFADPTPRERIAHALMGLPPKPRTEWVSGYWTHGHWDILGRWVAPHYVPGYMRSLPY